MEFINSEKNKIVKISVILFSLSFAASMLSIPGLIGIANAQETLTTPPPTKPPNPTCPKGYEGPYKNPKTGQLECIKVIKKPAECKFLAGAISPPTTNKEGKCEILFKSSSKANQDTCAKAGGTFSNVGGDHKCTYPKSCDYKDGWFGPTKDGKCIKVIKTVPPICEPTDKWRFDVATQKCVAIKT